MVHVTAATEQVFHAQTTASVREESAAAVLSLASKWTQKMMKGSLEKMMRRRGLEPLMAYKTGAVPMKFNAR